MRIVLALLMAALPAAALASSAAGKAQPVRLPAGSTSLLDIGSYRVAYKLDGKAVVDMPWGWSGQFTSDAGIAYTAFGRQNGKRALLIHCPWRRGPGVTFAEYHLQLPRERPLRFVTAIAMWSGRQGRGDGATFRASIAAAGASRTLFDEHHSGDEWKELQFDLDDLAGQQVVLHLEVDPGPARDPGWDYSLWGDPRVVAGAEPSLPERLNELLRKRSRWTAAADLRRLANDRSIACRPSVGERHSNAVVRRGDEFTFEYRGRDCRITYSLPAGDPRPSNITVRVNDLPAVPVCSGEGLDFPGAGAAEASVESAGLENDELVVVRRFDPPGIQLTTRIAIKGKSLVIATEADRPGASAYHLGSVGAVPFRRAVSVPYLSGVDVQYLPDQAVFISSFLDWVKTNASSHDDATALYRPLTDGSRNRLTEVGYVTVSPDLREVLPNVPYAPSPYLPLLAPRVVLDVWSRTFDEDAALMRELRSYGVRHAAIIHHAWQRGGYDNELPNTLPANAGLGGEDGMKRYSAEAARAGYLFALHENYVDFYPNSELYTEDDVARSSDGSPVKAWFNAGTGIQSFATKPTAMLKYARKFSGEIHRRYGTTAAYLDVHPCVPPWFHVDYQAGVPRAGTASEVRSQQEKLFAYERIAHGGPLFGEGNRHFYWAGIVDGVEAQVEGGESAPLLLDFDLLKIHPQMVNHGMGYYERWLKEGYSGDWWSRMPSQARIDRYRSTEIAFGHAGFVGNPLLDMPDYAAKEHHLVSPVQSRYGAARATEIEYEIAGRMVDASVATALGIFDRVHVRYDSGLQIWVNRAAEDWTVRGHIIPTDGFLALAPGLTAGTLRIGGLIADVCGGEDSVYADARSFVRLPSSVRKRIRPTVKSFRSLGDRRFSITYAWEVGEKLDQDYRIFVHFDPTGEGKESIAFQQDHSPPSPTSQWKPGAVVVDGPYEVSIPKEAPGSSFKLTIGLFMPGGARVPLMGNLDSTQRTMLGTITLTDDGPVAFEPEPSGGSQMERADAAYLDRMNPGKELVDFGAVETNGAVLVRRRGGAVEVIPVPRDAAYEVALPVKRWGLPEAAPLRVRAVDADGKDLGEAGCAVAGGKLRFQTRPGAAAYLIGASPS